MSALFGALALMVNMALEILVWIIIARALISWVSPDPYNPIVQTLNRITEPVLEPFRRLVPIHSIGVDISPILAIIVVYGVRYFLVQVLNNTANYFR